MKLLTEELSFAYENKQVLDHVSFSLEQGELLCIMGANGTGKTTLIDNILGIHKPKSGSISLDGQNISEIKKHELAKMIAYVPQNHAPSFPYTVREVVSMGRTAYTPAFGEPGEDDEAHTDRALVRLGLEELADRPYSKLSGGELRLVLLARALCQGTPLICMDEPTAHLDFRNEMKFLETVSKLCKEDHIGILMATHSPDHAFYFEAEQVNTKAVFLKEGKVFAQGRPGEIIDETLIADVYGVRANIHTHDGRKSVSLIHSL